MTHPTDPQAAQEIDQCGRCGGQLWRDEHPDGIAVGAWQCSNCDWYQETPFVDDSLQDDLPF